MTGTWIQIRSETNLWADKDFRSMASGEMRELSQRGWTWAHNLTKWTLMTAVTTAWASGMGHRFNESKAGKSLMNGTMASRRTLQPINTTRWGIFLVLDGMASTVLWVHRSRARLSRAESRFNRFQIAMPAIQEAGSWTIRREKRYWREFSWNGK